QVVWMGLPDERGRADIFEHYLRGLKLDPRLTPDRLAAEMAGAAHGLTGVDIAYVCQRATAALAAPTATHNQSHSHACQGEAQRDGRPARWCIAAPSRRPTLLG